MKTGSASTSEKRLIPNELLCYAFAYSNCSAIGSLVNCICEFYQPDEIAAARKLLWKECEQFLSVQTKKVRRLQVPTDSRSAKPFAEDLNVWVNLLKNLQKPTYVTFCAIDVRKLPPCPLEEINLFSIVARVTALEKKFKTAASADPSRLVHEALPNQSLVQNNSSSTTMGNRKDTTIAPLSEKRVQFAERAAPTDNPREPDLKRSWTTVVKTSRRRPLQLLGRRIGETDTEIKSRKPLKQLFVYGVDSVCDADALKGFMDKQGVRPKQVHRVSKATWLRASFRVTVEEEDLEKVRQAKFWPSGVMCREWLNSVPKKPPQDNSNFEDVFAESFAHDDTDAEEDEHKNDDGNDT
ncbi:hypothetical protein CAPTEDRAFT_193633 [Capitella teleta]|uniref:Uncharacterized protein n=1 Tax=Capitella teleta TaxID=283909 RepID=R7VBH0_CAPTE|nr:hypothetical protein CAPTEDRAFT_193633 [Capitella teleta]|eukprot:ELU15979.1 hypothetical protein CAPTEDRAFT_193633 [Capitella teleta]